MAFKKETKNGNLNGCIWKARVNSEPKLTFSESSFNFLLNIVVFCTLQPLGYTAGGSAPYNPRCHCQRLKQSRDKCLKKYLSNYWGRWFCSQKFLSRKFFISAFKKNIKIHRHIEEHTILLSYNSSQNLFQNNIRTFPLDDRFNRTKLPREKI